MNGIMQVSVYVSGNIFDLFPAALKLAIDTNYPAILEGSKGATTMQIYLIPNCKGNA
jgi:hypothetical protein